jgi:DNA-directed RNA polymerase specialized sigma24 family protein
MNEQRTLVAEVVTNLLDDLDHLDVIGRLAVTRSLIRTLDADSYEVVTEARVAGYTWQEIGDAMGVSRQAAFMKYATMIGEE